MKAIGLTGAVSNPDLSAPETLERLVHRAEKAGASDIHLQMLGSAAQVAFRLDGILTQMDALPEGIADRVFGRIKFLAGLKTYQDSMPQDGRVNKGDLGCQNDIRVATYPTVTGEKIVLRLFNGGAMRSLRELEFPASACEQLESFLRSQCGMLLLTGPAGSGKTTTIYACLRFLSKLGGRHVITVEDPVEQVIPGIMQTEVNEARGLTFATAARHLLRQDPEVLVIGEIRDEQTAGIAVRAALTGHLVISTLHAGSTRSVFERLLALCPDRHAAISSVELVLNQRLLRRVCASCAGAGCETCLQTGYRGRVPILEWWRADDSLREQIRDRGPTAVHAEPSLQQSAWSLVAAGTTNRAEYQRIFGS